MHCRAMRSTIRKEACDSIRAKSFDLIEITCYDEKKVWRMAEDVWLLDHGFVAVFKKGLRRIDAGTGGDSK